MVYWDIGCMRISIQTQFIVDFQANFLTTIDFYSPPHKKWRGIMLYPPNRLSVRPSMRPSVRPAALRFRTLT